MPLLHAVSLPGGPVEHGTYDRIKGELIERLRRAGPLDRHARV
ncbi:M81 family metallopeptidase [Streptomyces asiaticus]